MTKIVGMEPWIDWIVKLTGCTREVARAELIAEEGDTDNALLNVRYIMKTFEGIAK